MFAGYTMGELGSIIAMQGFAGLILFSVFVLMALGLAIIFGQMGVINMAHGEFMILGAYVTYLTSQVFTRYVPGLFAGYFFVAVVFAFLADGCLGHAGRMGADPAPVQTAARHAARDLGAQPGAATGLSLGVRRARGGCRPAGLDDGRHQSDGDDPDSDQRTDRHGADGDHRGRRVPDDLPHGLGQADPGRGLQSHDGERRRHRYAAGSTASPSGSAAASPGLPAVRSP